MDGRTNSGTGGRGGRGWPLRRYLTVLISMFVAAAGTGVWYAWVQSERDALAAAGQDATVGAHLAATQLGEVVDQVRASVAQVAASPDIVPAFSGSRDCVLSFGLTGGKDSGHLDVVRADGSVACSSRPPTGASDGHAGAGWLARALKEPLLAGPVVDQRTSRQALVITVPVVGRGVVVAFVDLELLGSAVARQFGGARGLEFMVLSRDGDLVVTRSVEADRWVGSPVGSTRFAVPATAEASDGTDVAGVRRVYGRATVAGLGWVVFAGADRAQALASAHRLVYRQSLILAGGLLAGLVATSLVNLRITRPIGRLGDAVRTAISTAGDSGGSRPIAVAGPREVTDLGRDFNNLVEEVGRELDRRRRAERTAHEAELSYRQLFDNNPYPMYVFDAETLALLEVNDAAVEYYGYPREELLSLVVTRLAPAEHVTAQTDAPTPAAIDRRGPVRQVKRDGTIVEVNVTTHVVSFRGRDARCAVIEDITEREQLERRLRQSHRLESLGQLAGGVAHDFNNLLGIIIGYAAMCEQEVETAARDDPRWETVRADLGQILQASAGATNVTRQLLSFARADVPHTQVIDLNTVVTGIEQLLRRSIGEDIDLQTHLTDQPAFITADPGQIEQVLLNLVVNARDAMPTGGTLTIDTAPTIVDEHYAAHHPGTRVGHYVRLRVSDSGTGMSQATIDRAFEPFFTTKPKGHGTGLGLATIYGIVTQTGGHAQIYSEPGVGTTFTALFTATTQGAADITGPGPRGPDTPDVQAHRHETILVVEDEEGLRLLTERILTRRGYTVIAAGDGPEAVDLAGRHAGSIDLLLTDVIMPHMSGYDLATLLRAAHPALPVIYMSGYAEPLLATRTTLPPEAVLLSKPVTEEQILTAIRRTLDTRQPHPVIPTPT
jgi:PAS domain S-box-containing protein